jgi:hypothetical protein
MGGETVFYNSNTIYMTKGFDTSVLGDFCISPTEADFLWSREFFFVCTSDDFLHDLTDLFPPLSFGEIFKFPFLLLLFL